jgi:hypothetical protein
MRFRGRGRGCRGGERDSGSANRDCGKLGHDFLQLTCLGRWEPMSRS